MKRTDSKEESTSGLMASVNNKKGKGKSKSSGEGGESSSARVCYWCKKSGHIKKDCFKFKEHMKKKGGSDSTKGKGDFAGTVDDMDPCDVLTAESGGERLSDSWLLD